MIYLFILFIADYFLTFYGIRIGAIYEGNPLWAAILNLPLYLGLPLRLIYFGILGYLPITLAKKRADKCRPIFVKAYYYILLTVNVGILGLHIRWLYIFFQ